MELTKCATPPSGYTVQSIAIVVHFEIEGLKQPHSIAFHHLRLHVPETVTEHLECVGSGLNGVDQQKL